MLKTHLQYQKANPQNPLQELHFNGKSLKALCAQYTSPMFIYDLDLVQNRFQALQSAWPQVQIHYAMKANSHTEVLKKLKTLGSRADVVSGGELKKALAAGMTPRDIIFSGVAKTKAEIELAIATQIHQINVESLPELERIVALANKMQKPISLVLRLNPDIEIKTHKYIATGLIENKFGIEISRIPELLQIFSRSQWVTLAGVSLHLGSQMLEFSGLQEALKKIKVIFKDLQKKNPQCQRFDFGGGLGILYDEINPEKELQMLQSYIAVVKSELSDLPGVELQTEPGRWLLAHAGILLCQVQYIKKTTQKNFVIVDSGMNHLLRPTLYESYHWIAPWQLAAKPEVTVDVVGPICESSDFFAKARKLPELSQDDFLIIADCGAYGASMSSDYNLQDRAQEVLLTDC